MLLVIGASLGFSININLFTMLFNTCVYTNNCFEIPSDIILARLICWYQCGSKNKSIEQAQIEKPQNHTSIVSDLDSCATAIAIDSSSMLN